MNKRSLSAVVILLLSSLAIGLAQVAILPPWEGFDETAHYSYVAELALLGHPPRTGDALAAAVEEYRQRAPMPYSSTPPYDVNGGYTYHAFFEAPRAVIEQGALAANAERRDVRWTFGSTPNWESIQPPLYYLALAPLFALSQRWNLVDQLFLLRAASLLIAWAGLCVTACAAPAYARASMDSAPQDLRLVRAMAIAPALWPFLFPGWFADMARLGNDCLVSLVASFIWFAIIAVARLPRLRAAAALGLLCGIGLLVKATVMPLAVAILGFQGLLAWRSRRDAPAVRARLLGLMVAAALMVLVAGWWYVRQWLATGDPTGSTDLTSAARAGGIATAVSMPGFPGLYARGWVNIVLSFPWSGTWSFVRLPTPLLTPFLAIGALLVLLHVSSVLRRRVPLHWVALLTLGLFAMALGYHLLNYIAAFGHGGTSSWYLHSLAPILASIVGTAIAASERRPWFRRALLAALAYALIYLLLSGALEATMFAGCGRKLSSVNAYDYGSMATCVGAFGDNVARLGVLASPLLAAMLLSAGLLLLGVAALIARPRTGDVSRESPAGPA